METKNIKESVPTLATNKVNPTTKIETISPVVDSAPTMPIVPQEIPKLNPENSEDDYEEVEPEDMESSVEEASKKKKEEENYNKMLFSALDNPENSQASIRNSMTFTKKKRNIWENFTRAHSSRSSQARKVIKTMKKNFKKFKKDLQLETVLSFENKQIKGIACSDNKTFIVTNDSLVIYDEVKQSIFEKFQIKFADSENVDGVYCNKKGTKIFVTSYSSIQVFSKALACEMYLKTDNIDMDTYKGEDKGSYNIINLMVSEEKLIVNYGSAIAFFDYDDEEEDGKMEFSRLIRHINVVVDTEENDKNRKYSINEFNATLIGMGDAPDILCMFHTYEEDGYLFDIYDLENKSIESHEPEKLT